MSGLVGATGGNGDVVLSESPVRMDDVDVVVVVV